MLIEKLKPSNNNGRHKYSSNKYLSNLTIHRKCTQKTYSNLLSYLQSLLCLCVCVCFLQIHMNWSVFALITFMRFHGIIRCSYF